MLFNTLTFAATCLITLSSASVIKKQSTETVSLYAYGDGISDTRNKVFYGDGLAWIGYAKPDWLSVVSDITFTEDPDSTTSSWTVNSQSSLWTDGAYELYIIPTAGSFEQVGFVPTAGSAPTGGVQVGFNWYGNDVAWVQSNSNWELQFWAVPTNTTGIWQLMWDAGATNLPTGSTPVTVKKET